jgi:putative transposase
MKVFSIAKGFHKLAKDTAQGEELSDKELNRLRAITVFQRTGDTRLVCDTFGVSRATLYRWVKGFDPKDLCSVKERSRRPRHVRKPEWSQELAQAVKNLREQYPRWGKDKLAVLLGQRGWHTSVSTVGRILARLKQRGQLVEPARKAISAKRRRTRPYAERKPKEYQVLSPGDLVQIVIWDKGRARPLIMEGRRGY